MRRLPGEFEPQGFVQIIFPHGETDWASYLPEAQATFAAIASAIATYQPCLIVCDDVETVQKHFEDTTHLHFVPYLGNDAWARDCSGITVYEDGMPRILDFTFTGWGGKYASDRDNAMTTALAPHYSAPVTSVPMILEGGAIDSNGQGTLLTTSECLLNPNRNAPWSRHTTEAALKEHLGIEQFLWLDSGYLRGDDTDSHIDTLARFIATDTIMYVQCHNPSDEHYDALKAMEKALISFRQSDGTPFHLIPLPMCDPVYYEDERLPATYANFLMLNGAVLVPVYHLPQDAPALRIFQEAFPQREIIPIDCSILIRQHGSLHCVTMQFPEGVCPQV